MLVIVCNLYDDDEVGDAEGKYHPEQVRVQREQLAHVEPVAARLHVADEPLDLSRLRSIWNKHLFSKLIPF